MEIHKIYCNRESFCDSAKKLIDLGFTVAACRTQYPSSKIGKMCYEVHAGDDYIGSLTSTMLNCLLKAYNWNRKTQSNYVLFKTKKKRIQITPFMKRKLSKTRIKIADTLHNGR